MLRTQWTVCHRWPDDHPHNPASVKQSEISDVVSETGWPNKEKAEGVMRAIQDRYPGHEIWIEEPNA